MSWRRELSKLRAFFRRSKPVDDLSKEIRAHLAMEEQENLEAGMPAEEARYAALRRFGNVTQAQERTRESWTWPWLETLFQDLRFGLRQLRRNPGFTVVAVLTLALGIGTTTAVFSVVDRILFRSLPYPEADRLAAFGILAPIETNEFLLSYQYLDWRAQQTPFESVTSWRGVGNCDLTEQNPVRMSCAQVEASFLPTFGIRPLLGRNFAPGENKPNAPKVALLSYGLWKKRFGSDPGVVGRTFSLDAQPTRIIGVLPADFELPNLVSADVVIPEVFTDEEISPRHTVASLVWAFGRLKPGITATQAHAALEPLLQQSLQEVAPQLRKDVRLFVQPLRERQIHDAKLAAWILLAAVFAVLLIACANVANLLLARAAARQREVALRAALGAGRRRLIRQTLTESLLLGAIGGAAGCVLAELMLRGFVAIAPEGIPRLHQATLDSRVLFFTLAVSLISGTLFGLAPALHLPPAAALAGRQVVSGGHSWFRQMLVVAQITFSLVLLAGASLLLRSLWKLENEPLGIETSNLLTANIVLGQQRYPHPAQQAAFFDELEQRLGRLPGVSALAISDSLPPTGTGHTILYAFIQARGRERYTGGTGGPVAYRTVTPGYFSALRIPILRGRSFSEQDRNPNENTIILSYSLARKLFAADDPIGQQLQFYSRGPWYTVIGVTADVKNSGLTSAPNPEYYLVRKHSAEQPLRWSSVLLRSSMRASAMAQLVRTQIAALDPTLPVTIETMDQHVGSLAQRARFNAALLSLFAAIGLLQAVFGIYGVMSFLVTQRTNEIGIRVALGAKRRDVLRLVVGQGLKPALIGVAIGVAGALALTRFLSNLLFGVKPADPLTFIAVSLILVAVALLACYVPARRAAKVDPMVALRYE